MMKRRSGVYFILCLPTGRHYVGSSVNIDRRWSDHISRLRAGTCNSPKLQNAWLKYGSDAFVFGVLEEVDSQLLHDRETFWITSLSAADAGLNVFRVPGWVRAPSDKIASALMGRRHTAETKAKMSAAHKGRRHPAAVMAKIAAALRGKEVSPEQREKLREMSRNRSPEVMERLAAANRLSGVARRGVPRSDDLKAKVSAGLRAYYAAKKAATAA